MKRLFIICMALCACSSFAQELIFNGGFETGDFTGWNRQSDTFLGAIFGEGHSSDYGAEYLGPQGDYQTLGQTLATTPGQTYTFSLWTRTSSATQGFENLQVWWNGATVFDGRVLWTDYQRMQFQVQATSTATPIVVGAYGNASTVVDDVSVAVPEPASLAAIGAGCLLMGRRRRRL